MSMIAPILTFKAGVCELDVRVAFSLYLPGCFIVAV